MDEPKGDALAAIAQAYIGPGAGERLQNYSAYLKHYQRATASDSSEKTVYQIDRPLLQSHQHIQYLVTKLRENPTTTRLQFEDLIHGQDTSVEQETQHAIRTVMRVGFMLDSSMHTVGHSTKGHRFARWEKLEKFSDFVSRSIPKQDEATLIPYEDIRATSAWNLKHKSGLKLKRTDDLAEHLLYDPSTQTLKIFHQMAWLRAQLEKSKGTGRYASIEDSLRNGTLPPQLIVETLESFYRILFPIAKERGSKSKNLLRLLMRRRGFDSQCSVETHPGPWLPEDFQYFYWGERLEIVSQLAQKTRTGNRYTAWIERHTTERQAISIAIAGVVFTATFGFLTLIVASAQLAVQVVTWLYPK